ncbi:RNA polymerase sigma-I factor [Cohnella lubricantis]|uniref:RNA polymerase sigma-I factor n=1 Tax=Cohnella lubricantis TaxID=2163172 RepID=UPI0021AB8CE7|nr:RNA polymerase sigma-I factor [Cohnella lubricantis]
MWGELLLLLLWRKWTGRGSAAPAAVPAMLPEEAVAAIQNGDEALRNEWIIQYEPFIAKTASKFAKRYIDPERDDEYSIALTAFDEAISRYSPDAGSSFLSFASQVIQRRLIDHLRREQRHAAAVPYSALQGDRDEDTSLLAAIEAQEAIEVYARDRAAEERRAEIEALTAELAHYGISFADLSEQSPKHQDSRDMLLGIGRRLAQNAVLFGMLADKRQLPLKELCEIENVSRKTLERNRKYLIAVALIARGPYPLMQEYIIPSPATKEEVVS